jgi:hypothetical protein
MGFSQDKVDNKGNWSIGITFSPDNYFKSTSILTGSEIGYQLEPSGFDFSSGLVGLYSIESKFDIGLGIDYSQKGFTGTFYCSTCDFLTAPQPEKLSQQFIEIPLFVRYNILNKKLGLHADAGFTNGYMINNINTQYEGPLNCNKFQFIGQIGLGIDLNFGQKMSLLLSSAYYHPFTSFSKGTNSNFNYFNFLTGITYKFNKNKTVD